MQTKCPSTDEWRKKVWYIYNGILLLLLLSRFSRVQLCATPQTAAHQAPPSLGFSRQEYWSGLPFPSPMHESEKWMEYYSAIKKSKMPFAATWTDLKIIILSEVSQRQIYVQTKKKNANLFTKQKQTHRHRRQTYGYQRGREKDKLGVWD